MESVEEGSKVDQQKGSSAAQNTPWSYRLVVIAILSVTIAFIAIMVMFAAIDVFDKENSANITAALSSLFGIVGTLVGAYFGIKASSDAQDRMESTQTQALASTTSTAKQAVADQKETAKQAVTVGAASERPQGARGASPMKVALATLIPLAGGAGLLALRYYLRRMDNTA